MAPTLQGRAQPSAGRARARTSWRQQRPMPLERQAAIALARTRLAEATFERAVSIAQQQMAPYAELIRGDQALDEAMAFGLLTAHEVGLESDRREQAVLD
eukprot:2457898-Prymnesium_polylepis.1